MNEQAQQQAGQPPQILIKAIRKVLRPLVRLMLSYQITFPFVMNLLKSIYVEVAEEDFQVDGKRSSDSRINLLTGVHRKDVKRLRLESHEQSTVPRSISVGSQLIAYWLGSEQFQDDQGKPRALPLKASVSGSHAVYFDDLVTLVCRQDIRPRVILDEWLHLGIATLEDDGMVRLNTGSFTPRKGFDEKVFFFGKNLHDHLSAGTDNLLGQQPARFDRSVYYDRLSAESVAELAALAEETGMQALRTMNQAALSLQQRDQGKLDDKAARHYRINFGIFNYNTGYEPVDENDPEGDHHA